MLWESLQQKVSQLFASLEELNPPIRYSLIALLGSIAGSGYLGLLSEYSTYVYAWSEGFRIPAEGVPYLKATVIALSFISLLLGFAIFLIVYFLGILIWKSSVTSGALGPTNTVSEVATEIIRKLPFGRVFRIGFWGSIIIFSILFIKLIHEQKTLPYALAFSFSFSIAYFILILMMWRKLILLVISASFAIFFSIASPLILFDDKFHSGLLQELGFGGGLPIHLRLKGEDDELKTRLYLRTNSSIFIGKPNSNIFEYSNSKIRHVEYVRN